MRHGPRGAWIIVALALSLASVTVVGQQIVVAGEAVYKDANEHWMGAAKREIGLYGLRGKGPQVTSAVTSEQGEFKLSATYQMSGETAYVVDEQGAALPLAVKVPSARDGARERQAEGVRLELFPCDPIRGIVRPEHIKTCLTAAGQTHRAKLRAGAETASEADKAFRERAHALLMNVPAWREAEIAVALAELERPLVDQSLPRLPSVSAGDVLQDARQVLASRIGQCFDGVKTAAGEGGYLALGDRCEGDCEIPTAGGAKLVSLTEGSPRLNVEHDAVTLSWTGQDAAVCLTVQPQSVDLTLTKLPRWRMTRRATPGEDRFSWNVGRARATGVTSGPLGFLAEPCNQDAPHGPMYIPVRVAGSLPEKPSFSIVIRTTAEVRKVDVTVTETYADGKVEKVSPKVGPFSPRDPHPRIWFEIPRSSKGPATARVLVTLEGSGTVDDQKVGPFFFKHD